LSKVGLFCVADADDICGGVVGKVDGGGGGAARFCTRLKTECRYGKQGSDQGSEVLHQDPSSTYCTIAPFASMLCLQVPTEDNNSHLENRLQTMDVWVTYFNLINAHKVMNLAGRLATRKTMAVTGLHKSAN
jgi:hypothetical protein